MTSRATLGEIKIAARPVSTNQGFKNLIPSEQIDGWYLYYQMLFRKKQYASFGIGSTFLEVSKKDTARFEIPVPPKQEQTAIAKVLISLDTAIRKTEAIVAKLQAVKQGLLHDLLTRGLDASGQLRPPPALAPELYQDSPLGLIPKEWEVANLKQLAETITSGSRGWATYYADEGALFVRIGNLTREHINFRLDDKIFVDLPENTEGARTALSEGDLLISITADLGIIAVVPNDFPEAYINQHIALVRIPASKETPRFIGHYLSSKLGQAQFQRLNDGGAKAGLNLPTIASLLTVLPPANELALIVKRLDMCDAQIVDQKLALQKQIELKSGLMDDLLTGRVRVKVLDTEKA